MLADMVRPWATCKEYDMLLPLWVPLPCDTVTQSKPLLPGAASLGRFVTVVRKLLTQKVCDSEPEVGEVGPVKA